MNDSIFPFIQIPEEYQEEESELNNLCEYAYDFANNCLLKNKDGHNYFVYDNEALKIWIYKALRTSRYNYLAYTDDFGNEMHELIGKSIDTDVMKLEIKRFITETLMFSPYIKAISNFELEVAEKVFISFDIESIYGEMNYTDELKEGVYLD